MIRRLPRRGTTVDNMCARSDTPSRSPEESSNGNPWWDPLGHLRRANQLTGQAATFACGQGWVDPECTRTGLGYTFDLAKGVGQGWLNLFNGVQDLAVGIANIPAGATNAVA